jgi:hypothetical protein
MGRQRRSVLLAAAALLGLTLLVYWPVRSAGFSAWDDRDQIRFNPDFNPPRLANLLAYARGPYRGSLYPLSYGYLGAVAWIDRSVRCVGEDAPLDPSVFHLASVLLHAAAAMGTWLLLRRLNFGPAAALAGAALFAVHPMQADAVAWASGFNTVLSGGLVIAALWLYLPRDDAAGFVPALRLGAATLCYAAALAAKPSAVVTPLLAAALEWAIAQPQRRRGRLVLLGAWLALAAPVMLITRHVQGAGGVAPTPMWFRPVVAIDAIAFYVWHVAWPARLLVDYGRSPALLLAGGAWRFTWLITAAFALLGAIALRRRWSRAVPAGMAVFVLGVLPVLGLTPFNGQTISTVADRFLYLSMLGAAMLVAWLWQAGGASAAVRATIIAALLALAVRTNLRSRDWHDDATLFAVELRGNPASLAAHEVLGDAAGLAGDNALAAWHYAAALRVNRVDARIPFDLANALLRSGHPADAIPYYRLAEADQARNSAVEPLDARLFYNHGVADVAVGDLIDAGEEFTRARQVDPRFQPAKTALDRLERGATRP